MSSPENAGGVQRQPGFRFCSSASLLTRTLARQKTTSSNRFLELHKRIEALETGADAW